MRKICKGLLILGSLTAVGLTGCSDDSPWRGSDTEGGINLQLATDGRLMKHSTRADDSMSPIVPDGNAFAISLNHVDGSYSKTWSDLNSFNKEESFPIGNYKINATYGDVEREGFELPCFAAEEDVHVAPGETSDVSMVATLANSMVSVRFTDDFISNFPQYSAAVQTPGHDWVVFGQTESRPAYVDPTSDGYTKVSVTMTNKQDKKVTVVPAEFQILPRRHYVVTVNATGNISQGNLTLDVSFEEDVVNETVEIALSDELFSSPAPEIKPKNFTDGQTISFIANEELDCDPQFDLFAFGGFEEVTMNVAGPAGYTPVFGKTVDFLSADDLTRKQLDNVGVQVSGLYPVAGLMAVVNIKKYLEQVPAGNYTITLQAKDKMTRLSEPVVLKATVNPFQMELSEGAPLPYRGTELLVIVASNSLHFANNLNFTVKDSDDNPIEAELKNVYDTSVSGFASAKKCVLSVAPIVVSEVKVKVSCGRMDKEMLVDVVDPEYNVEVDAFATHVILRVSAPDDPELENDLVAHLGVYNGTRHIDESRITRSTEKNLIIVDKCDPGVTFQNIKTKLGVFEKSVPAFTTEADTDVTNGNFSTKGTNLTFNGIQVGGKYRVSPVDYTLKVNINRDEPRGWATVNSLTASTSSKTKNTWFVVPSTYMENGAVTIRSVGYNHDGTVPATSGGAFNTTYYCTNAPSDAQLNKAAGELFLGSYPQGNARTKGIDFASRPSTLTFDYKYTPLNGEQAQADIMVYDATGNVIAQNQALLSATPDMQTVSLPLTGYPFGTKAAKIYIGFRSTKEDIPTPAINIPSGSALDEGQGLGNHTLPENTYKALATGSVLVVDNVKLGYDEVTTVLSAPRKVSRKVKR